MKTPVSHVPCQPVVRLLLIPLFIALTGLVLPSRARADEVTLIDLTSTVWRYNDAGTNSGTAWRAVDYPTESMWRTGTGLFGVETTVPPAYPAPLQTSLVMGAGHITYYFRTRFLVGQNHPLSNIVSVTAFIDDGAVVYLNGTEIQRIRLTNDPVLFDSKAQLAAPEGIPWQFQIDPTNLVLGTNVIAVEVHQQNENSSDVVFGFKMVATGTLAPTILDPEEPRDREVHQGDPTTFSVVGTGIPAPDYRWYGPNGALIPGANEPTYSIAQVDSSHAGTYFAVLSNSVGTATSRVAMLNYIPDTNAPYVLYALLRPDSPGIRIVLPFSEPPHEESARDNFNWEVTPNDDPTHPLTVHPVLLEEGTNVILVVDSGDPLRSYNVRVLGDIYDKLLANFLPAETIIPVAAFPVELVRSNSSWHYEISGTDLGTNWAATAFSDAGWSNGPAPLDAFRAFADMPEPHCRSDGMLPIGDPIGTCLGSLSNATATAQYSTAYFRTRFHFSGDAAHSVLSIQPILVDDGAVFYLNGIELFRLGMPDGLVSYATLANRTVGNVLPEFRELAPRGLVEGENVLAVEVHQVSLLDADLTLGVSVSAFVPSVVASPQLSSVLEGGNITISWTPAVGMLQSATEIDGDWTDVSSSNPYTEPAVGPQKFYRIAVK